MANAVDDDLCHRTLPDRIVPGLIQDCRSHTVDRTGLLGGVAGQTEGAGSRVGAFDERDAGVERARFVGIEILEGDGLDGRRDVVLQPVLRGGDSLYV